MRTGCRPRMKESLRPQVRFFCCAPTNASRVFTQPGSKGAKGDRLVPTRRFAAAVAALLLTAGALVAFSVADAQAQAQAATCEDGDELALLPSPLAPWKGAPLRVIFAVERPFEGELALIAPDGSVAAKSREQHGGPPYFWLAEVA